MVLIAISQSIYLKQVINIIQEKEMQIDWSIVKQDWELLVCVFGESFLKCNDSAKTMLRPPSIVLFRMYGFDSKTYGDVVSPRPIGATHLTSTITCTSFYVLSWPGRHFWRGRGFHRVWRELTDVNIVVQSHITKCGTMNIDGLPWPQNVLNTAKLS